MIDAIVNSSILNWENILSDNLAKNIMEYRSKRSVSSREIHPLYMSAYIMDAICFSSIFLTMGWKWTTQDPTPIHIYHRALWDSDFHLQFFFHRVMLPMHQMIFNEKALGFPNRLVQTFCLLLDGSQRKVSLMSWFFKVMLLLMSYHIMFLISYLQEKFPTNLL